MTLRTVCVSVCACALTHGPVLSLTAQIFGYFGVTRANLKGALFKVGCVATSEARVRGEAAVCFAAVL